MKHTNQGDSNRNQTAEKDQQRKSGNAQSGDKQDSMGQQNKQEKKDHSAKKDNRK
jgi:hypothetical protein